jgi:hypothetical protein
VPSLSLGDEQVQRIYPGSAIIPLTQRLTLFGIFGAPRTPTTPLAPPNSFLDAKASIAKISRPLSR